MAPTPTTSRARFWGGEQGSVTALPGLGAQGFGGLSAAQTYPEHRHILDSQLVTHTDVLSTMRRALQVQQQPGCAVHGDVSNHSERIPRGEGWALAHGESTDCIWHTARAQ